MTSLVICPHCDSRLAEPLDGQRSNYVACPMCAGSFELTAMTVVPLPRATFVPPPGKSVEDRVAEKQKAENLHGDAQQPPSSPTPQPIPWSVGLPQLELPENSSSSWGATQRGETASPEPQSPVGMSDAAAEEATRETLASDAGGESQFGADQEVVHGQATSGVEPLLSGVGDVAERFKWPSESATPTEPSGASEHASSSEASDLLARLRPDASPSGTEAASPSTLFDEPLVPEFHLGGGDSVETGSDELATNQFAGFKEVEAELSEADLGHSSRSQSAANPSVAPPSPFDERDEREESGLAAYGGEADVDEIDDQADDADAFDDDQSMSLRRLLSRDEYETWGDRVWNLISSPRVERGAFVAGASLAAALLAWGAFAQFGGSDLPRNPSQDAAALAGDPTSSTTEPAGELAALDSSSGGGTLPGSLAGSGDSRLSVAGDEVRVDPRVEAATAEETEDRSSSAVAKTWPVTPLMQSWRDPPVSTLDDLRAATDAAESARSVFLEGDLSDLQSVSRKGKAYMTLCELARTLTMLERVEMKFQVVSQLSVAKELLRGIMARETNREALSQIAGRWWEYRDRPSPGIFFVGRIRDANAMGRWTLLDVEVSWATGSVQAPVLCDSLKFAIGDELAVIGAVVDDPAVAIEGYEGSAPQLVLAGHAFEVAATSGGFIERAVQRVTKDLMDAP
ncbi:MAG: hypothetical protein KDA61_03190 [Planctomycetales bacterium]|nr:hypothetical protein [Planctomycetales bacterium]